MFSVGTLFLSLFELVQLMKRTTLTPESGGWKTAVLLKKKRFIGNALDVSLGVWHFAT
jgi:hypothetical protein